MRRELRDSVVVLVGASSGIGRATALALADEGARLVLAARSADALEEVAAACRDRGVDAVAVPTDIGDADQVDRLAEAAVARHGRIDTWINAAAMLVAGTLGDEPVDEAEQVVRTNVLGPVLAARAVLPRFREQGGGVLIEVASLLAVLPNPVLPLYVMSKFAVRGLALSLHHLVSDWPGVRVCVVLPGPVDTPIYDRGADHTGGQMRTLPPAVAPERAAAAIISCARRPRRQVPVGWTARFILVAHRLSPRLVEWILARVVAALLVKDQPADERTGDGRTGDGPTGDDPTGDDRTGDDRVGDRTGGGPTGDDRGGDRTGEHRIGGLRRRAGEAVGRARTRIEALVPG